MSARITRAGLSSMAKAQAENRPWVHRNYVLAYVPGLNFEQEIPDSWVLNERQIVRELPITREGFADNDQVVYSLFLGADEGDYQWNVEALRDEQGNITAVSWMPLVEKRKNREGLSGNVLARNFIQQFNAAKTLTGITIPAESWQFDFTAALDVERMEDAILHSNIMARQIEQAHWIMNNHLTLLEQ